MRERLSSTSNNETKKIEVETVVFDSKSVEPPDPGQELQREILNFDQSVLELRNRGYSRTQIKEELGLTTIQISASINRLIKSGDTASMKGRYQFQESLDVARQIKIFRGEGLTTKETALKLGLPVGKVQTSINHLVKFGEVAKKKINGQRSEETIAFDNKVKELRERGLTQRQIADNLSVPHSKIKNSVMRLVIDGQIKPKKLRRLTKTQSDFDSQVLKLRNQGFSRKKIEKELGSSKGQVSYAIRRLSQKGEIVSLSKYTQKKGETETVLKRLLGQHMEKYPDKNIVLSLLAKELGITRERARQLYRKIAKQNTVPFLKKTRINEQSEEEGRYLDEKINALRKQGITQNEIVTELNIGRRYVADSLKRQYQKLTLKVEELRSQQVTYLKIGEKLGESRGVISYIIKQLIKSGELDQVRKRRSKKEVEAFRVKVKKLRLQGLMNKQISEELNESEMRVANAVNALLKREEISRKTRSRKEAKILKTRIRDLRNKGATYKEVAGSLKVSFTTVSKIIHDLIKNGEVEYARCPGETRGKIKELKGSGLTNKEIADLLNITYDNVVSHVSQLRKKGEIAKRMRRE